MDNKFRSYNADDIIGKTYQLILENQTFEYALTMKDKFTKSPFRIYNIWEIIQILEEIIDDSDPDNNLPQIVHSYQTAEEIKNIFF